MNPTIQALKAALLLAATHANTKAKQASVAVLDDDDPRAKAFQLGRVDAFREALRLIETVARIETEGET